MEPCKQTPAIIRCQECHRPARSRQHRAKLAGEDDHLHNVAEKSLYATQPPPVLPASAQPPHLPSPPPAPRAVRNGHTRAPPGVPHTRTSLKPGTSGSSTLCINHYATRDLQPQQSESPSPERAASPVVKEAQASPIVHCSQYRKEDYERQNRSLPGHEKVGSWLRDVQAAYESYGPSSYLTQPAAPRKDQYVLATRTRTRITAVRAGAAGDGRQLRASRTRSFTCSVVHKDYEGLLPLCYHAKCTTCKQDTSIVCVHFAIF